MAGAVAGTLAAARLLGGARGSSRLALPLFYKVFALQIVVGESVMSPLRGSQTWDRDVLAKFIKRYGEFPGRYDDCRSM